MQVISSLVSELKYTRLDSPADMLLEAQLIMQQGENEYSETKCL